MFYRILKKYRYQQISLLIQIFLVLSEKVVKIYIFSFFRENCDSRDARINDSSSRIQRRSSGEIQGWTNPTKNL